MTDENLAIMIAELQDTENQIDAIIATTVAKRGKTKHFPPKTSKRNFSKKNLDNSI